MKEFEFYRFNELTSERINKDYHMHTTWTDGTSSSYEMLKASEEKGLISIAFTEHIRRDSDYYSDFYSEVDSLRKNSSISVLIGVEAKAVNESGDLDISLEYYNLAEIVLGSVHRVFKNNESILPRNAEKKFVLDSEYKQMLNMIKKGKIDVLAHPFGMSIRYFQDFNQDDVQEIIRNISKTDIAFEFNPRYVSEKFLEVIVKYCKQYNPYVSIGSDAHAVKGLGDGRALVESLINVNIEVEKKI